MSPARFHNPHNINGTRPSPLKINKESHLVQKQSSSSSISVIAPVGGDGGVGNGVKQQRKNPVIIYTHSPKVIHTQARDFMALVQKLTGLSSSGNDETAMIQKRRHLQKGLKPVSVGNEDNEPSSVSSTDEKRGGGDISPILNPPKNNNFADIPLFTPTAVDFFSPRSPRPVCAMSSPKMMSPMSSSVLEFIKGLPEY
ncbi:hypothetical protein JCGZ_18341 [Jatropha curcas]|uniref:VQ domain-containing protein n=1 Tax=Jatropha curcas TaxID=180498 RepID=A0A067KAY1_JATCU|nr:VQ motif-containing protein 8, chloroplastic [Jatropha curcas]KDP29420.1 hypothetical protein JCGZ_18341 [Jatropha curcas]